MGGSGFSAPAFAAFSFELVAWIERVRLMLLWALAMTVRMDHCDNTFIWSQREILVFVGAKLVELLL